MKIQDFKALNMKGKMVDVKVERYEVYEEHKWLVKRFIRYVNIIGEYAYDSVSPNNSIQEYCSMLIKDLKPIPIEEIDYALDILDNYFDLTQIKYFKIAGVLSAYENYNIGFSHRIMKRYFDDYKTVYIY